MTGLPFSQACENNKGPILEVLKRVFADRAEFLGEVEAQRFGTSLSIRIRRRLLAVLVAPPDIGDRMLGDTDGHFFRSPRPAPNDNLQL